MAIAGAARVMAGAARAMAIAETAGAGSAAGAGAASANGDGEIVAAVFALVANAIGNPPHRRVIEHQRLDERLHQIDEEVVAADVRELVRKNHLDLLGRETRERRGGEKNHRTQPADDG